MQEVTFTDLNSEGEGVGRLEDGRVVMVPRALMEDKATIRLLPSSSARVAKGEIVELIKSSPNRKEHLCPHYEQGCPASPLGILKSKAALEWKVAHLKETLRRLGGVSVEPLECIASPAGWRYRDRVELAVGLEEEVWKIGYRSAAGIVPIVNCLLADDRVGACIKALSSELTRLGVRQKAASNDGSVLRLQVGDEGGVVGALYIASFEPPVKFWKEWLKLGKLAGWEIRKVESMDMRHGFSQTIAGEGIAQVEVKAGVARVSLPAGTFTQTNQSMRKKLVDEALKGIPAGGKLLDLYGGYGAFGFEYIRTGGSCLVVDGDNDSTSAGRKAAAGKKIEFMTGNLTNPRSISGLANDFDAVIADPPYGGLSKAVVEWLQNKGPRRLVYLSCHPAALARDLKTLSNYRISEVQPVDMFPQTPDLETVVRMRRIS